MVGFVRRLGVPRRRRAGISLPLLSLPALAPGSFAARRGEDWSEDWRWLW